MKNAPKSLKETLERMFPNALCTVDEGGFKVSLISHVEEHEPCNALIISKKMRSSTPPSCLLEASDSQLEIDPQYLGTEEELVPAFTIKNFPPLIVKLNFDSFKIDSWDEIETNSFPTFKVLSWMFDDFHLKTICGHLNDIILKAFEKVKSDEDPISQAQAKKTIFSLSLSTSGRYVLISDDHEKKHKLSVNFTQGILTPVFDFLADFDNILKLFKSQPNTIIYSSRDCPDIDSRGVSLWRMESIANDEPFVHIGARGIGKAPFFTMSEARMLQEGIKKSNNEYKVMRDIKVKEMEARKNAEEEEKKVEEKGTDEKTDEEKKVEEKGTDEKIDDDKLTEEKKFDEKIDEEKVKEDELMDEKKNEESGNGELLTCKIPSDANLNSAIGNAETQACKLISENPLPNHLSGHISTLLSSNENLNDDDNDDLLPINCEEIFTPINALQFHDYIVSSLTKGLCNLCFEEKLEGAFFALECGHSYCCDCLCEFFSFHILNGSVDLLVCPCEICKLDIGFNDVKKLVGSALALRFATLKTIKMIENSRNIFAYCPGCSQASEYESAVTCGECIHCNFSFCPQCLRPSHEGMCNKPIPAHNPKPQAEKKKKNREYDMVKKPEPKTYSSESASLNWIKKNAKSCPSCHSAIHKIEGCNKVFCVVCHKYFCYICGISIDSYDHFNKPNATCPLFSDHSVNVIRAPQIVRFRMTLREMKLGNVRKCSRCKSPYEKERSHNMIVCINCGETNCFLCGKKVSSLKHFSTPNELGEFCRINTPFNENLRIMETPPHNNYFLKFLPAIGSYSVMMTTKSSMAKSRSATKEICEEYDDEEKSYEMLENKLTEKSRKISDVIKY